MRSHWRGPLITAACVSTLGGPLFGYDNIVISGAIGYLSLSFHLDAGRDGVGRRLRPDRLHCRMRRRGNGG